MSGCVYYQTSAHGLDNPAGQRHITYFGVTYRVPRTERATVRQLEWERSPAELLRSVRTRDGRELEPDLDGTIERVETIDQATGDLLVMYRIPYRTC